MGLFRKLVLVFTIVPLVEFLLFWQIGKIIGIPVTIATILITGVLGAWLTRLEGFRTLTNFQKSLSEGRLPHRELIEGILILVAGAVLLTPGFLTDFAGFSLLIPKIRERVADFVGKRLKDKVTVITQGSAATPASDVTSGTKQKTSSEVINVESEVIDDVN